MDSRELFAAITSMDDDEIKMVEVAIKSRRQYLTAQRFAGLKVGDKVRLAENGRPKYIAGAVGTVMEKRRTKVVVDLDEPHGKFHRNVVCPPELLELG